MHVSFLPAWDLAGPQGAAVLRDGERMERVGSSRMCAHEVAVEASARIDLQVEPEVACLFAGVRDAFRAVIQRETHRWPADSEVFECLLVRALQAWTVWAPGARTLSSSGAATAARFRAARCCATSTTATSSSARRFRSAGGTYAAWNRVTLCAFQHQRGVDRGELGVRGRAPDALVFERGLRAGQPLLARFTSGDVRVA